MSKIITVDAIGDTCPIPVIKTKKALEAMTGAGSVQIHVDNEIAVQNLSKMAKQKQISCSSEKIEEKHFVVTMKVEESSITENGKTADEETSCIPDSRNNSIVVISSAVMGEGNDELGKVLMKGFIYGLSQLEQLPKTILFYNGGATLTTTGSDSLEDLKSMEAQGVEILTCGTCLNYYGLSDKLEVGDVTNMYVIVEKMSEATKIIKP